MGFKLSDVSKELKLSIKVDFSPIISTNSQPFIESHICCIYVYELVRRLTENFTNYIFRIISLQISNDQKTVLA